MTISDSVLQDFRHGFRLACRAPGTTLLIVAVLAIGMGAGTAVFSVLNNTLLRPLMLERVEDLVRIDDVRVGPADRGTGSNISPLNGEALIGGARTLQNVTVQQAQWFVLTGGGEPERLRGASVSANWHETLGVDPQLGRGFTAAELRAGAAGTAVLIGHDLWQRRFGGSADALGGTIVLDGVGRTVVGVMPRGFRFPYEAEAWIPLQYRPDDGANHYLLAFGRRTPGVALQSVNAELQSISEQLARAHPETNRGWVMRAQPLRENLVRGADRTTLTLLLTVAFLFAIACVNVAALMLARMTSRRRELLMRVALGATRSRLVRQVLTETMLLTLSSAVVGLVVTYVLFPMLGALVPPVMSAELAQNELVLDVRVFAFAIAATLLAVMITGLIPVLRTLPLDLQSALRGDGRGGGSRTARWTLRGLIIGEVTLAMVLLVGASGVVLGFVHAFGGNIRYDASRVLTLRLSPGGAAYPSPEERIRIGTAIVDDLRTLPDVESAALTTTNPRLGSWTSLAYRTDADPSAAGTEVQLVLVSPDYFGTLRVGIVGRDFTAADRSGGEPVAIVSRSLAETFWPNGMPASARLRTRIVDAPLTIVGIAADVRWATDPRHAMYLPWTQATSQLLTREFHLVLRTRGEPLDAVQAVRARIRDVAPDVPVFGVAALADVRGPAYVLERTGAAISAGFALFGLLISGMGILGSLTWAVLATRREYAVRQALGATPASILYRYLAEILTLLLAGSVLGAAGGAAFNRLLRHWLAEAVPVSGVTYGVIVVGILLLGTLTALVPALRAARTDAMLVLRDV